MRDSAAIDELNAVAEIMRRCWLLALSLQAGRQSWNQLASAASQDDFGAAGRLLWGWYRDSTLAGCRRLLDTSKHGPFSVVAALRRMHKIAPQVTPHVLATYWQGQGADESHGHLRERANRQLAALDGQSQPRLTKRTIKHDEDLLLRLHDDVIGFANRIVVHAGRRASEEPSVTEEQVNDLLEHVVDIMQRWVGLLDRAHLSAAVPKIIGVQSLRRALDLHDPRAYDEAVERERRRGDYRESYAEIESRVVIRYEVKPD